MGIAAGLLVWLLGACAAPADDSGAITTLPTPVEAEKGPESAAEGAVEPAPDDTAETEKADENAAIKIAILLPLSGPVAETGQALLNSATMALFDAYDPRLIMLPFDTAGDSEETRAAARRALAEGVDIILGPLLSENVQAAGALARQAGVPLIGFSNDYTAAAPGQYIFGFLPDDEIRRVVNFSVEAGFGDFAGLFPEGRYGDQVRSAYGAAVSANGAKLSTIETYLRDAEAVFEPVKALAEYDARRKAYRDEVRFLKALNDDLMDEIAASLEGKEVIGDPAFDAVLLPEGGALLRTIAPLLPFYEIDPEKIKVLGTGLWYDEGVLNEPPLYGAWFAAPDPAGARAFQSAYQDAFDDVPPRIATLAYDAVSLIASLAREESPHSILITDGEKTAPGCFSEDRLTDPNGFMGVDGLFRLLPEGTNERALAVLEVTKGAFKIVDPAPDAFASFGVGVRKAATEGND